ncbi:MAG: GxxExxY protein [Anaerolineales bacterium]|nr:GxxExxY protein [Anaerolineales bacterium]
MEPEKFVDERYPLSEVTGRIIGAAHNVHNGLGPGFQEVIYQRALALECDQQGLDFEREVEIPVYYRDALVGKKRVDFIIEGVMVEIKAKSAFDDADFIQTLSYLKASEYKIGLLLNFGAKKLEIKRFAN